METVISWLHGFGKWLMDLLLWVPLKLGGMVLEALAELIEGIPTPGWAIEYMPYVGGALDALGWVANLFLLPQGLTMVFDALLLRWVIRRIPLIG